MIGTSTSASPQASTRGASPRPRSDGPAESKREPRRTPVVRAVRDLMREEMPEPRFVVPGIISEGLTVFGATPKFGKTWMMMGISLAVARGGMALARLAVEPGAVLYLSLEDGARRLRQRFLKLCEGDRPPAESLNYATNWPKANEGGLDHIGHWLLTNPDARLVVVDTLKRFRPNRRPGANEYDADYESLEGLKRLADNCGVAIVVVHHCRKAEADDPLDMLSGTHGLTGAADSILVGKRARGQHDATLFVTGRDIQEETELALKFDNLTACWSLLGSAQDYCVNALARDILAMLRGAGAALRPNDVAKALGRTGDKEQANIRQTLKRLAAAGLVKSLGKGKYVPVAPVCAAPSPEALTTPEGGDASDAVTHVTPVTLAPSIHAPASSEGDDRDPSLAVTPVTVSQLASQPAKTGSPDCDTTVTDGISGDEGPDGSSQREKLERNCDTVTGVTEGAGIVPRKESQPAQNTGDDDDAGHDDQDDRAVPAPEEHGDAWEGDDEALPNSDDWDGVCVNDPRDEPYDL